MATATRKRPAKKNPHALTPEQRAERIAEAHDNLGKAVAKLATADGWKAAMQRRKWLRKYSFGNMMMILTQCPEASDVRTFNEWKAVGRFPEKGSGLKIWRPAGRKAAETEDAKTGEKTGKDEVFFVLTNVFDVSTTYGEPLETIELANTTPELLTGDAPAGLWDAASKLAVSLGCTIVREDPGGGANGRITWATRVIQVRVDVDDAQAAKTLVHEIAHLLCEHETRPIDRDTGEVEAESVACVVTAACGLDSLAYSVPYVAGWAGDLEAVAESAKVVFKVADKILEAIGSED